MRLYLILLVGWSIYYFKGLHIVENMEQTVILNEVKQVDPHRKILDDLQFNYKIRFPHICLGQMMHETAKFKSKIYKECNNATGMKYNGRGYAVGECRDHAKYNSIDDCLKDYAEWQALYLTHYEQNVIHRTCLTNKDYYRYLEWIGYARDTNYISLVDPYVKQIEKWEFKMS